MQIQINTDDHVDGTEALGRHVRAVVQTTMNRFSDRISRVEVHLGDENGHKGGPMDKRCMMEVRLEGRQPTAVTHHADTIHQAIAGAADKLERAVENVLGRLRDDHH